ncbi:hypothetical protein CHS0354_039903 [Potamilus streckersoni]|uniref:Uncharacterized protein n=1 Tax=Potamilus streckersoni TaxID=2493646 RepID=A0AAE0WCD2_9BIVA|nr:hypothetical protein CHS0354_039903 [Potamilus streckersoni]
MACVRAKICISASRTLYHIIILLFMQFFIKFSQGQGPGEVGESKFFNISENRDPETFIGSIDTRSSYTYSLNDGTLGTQEFRINQSTGGIFTKIRLDRESLNVSQDTFHLLIIGRSTDTSKQSYPVEVSIKILDENDNAPVFPSPSIMIYILESSHIGFKEFIPTASDADAGINQEIANYTFISGKGPFKLLYDPDVYGQVLFIQTTGELDRETKDYYEFIIAARDKGVPPLIGQLQVNITIQDANDNPPIFDPSEYFSTVNETDPLGTFVIRVIASDRDLGKNGDVTYNFLEENTVTKQFRIDERTGEIFTATEPLYCVRYCGIPSASCNPNSCLLTIEAKDGGIPQYTGRAFVYITVIDRNNHDPTITVEYKPDGNTQYSLVNEDAKKGDIVATITAEDQDVGVYGKISIVQIISGNDLRHFVLLSYNGYQSNILQVSGNNLLDRERNSLYNLTIEAADQGSPPRKTLRSIVIYINDVNDHTPGFQFSTYVVTLSELTPVGSFVASCLATDLDSGDNAKLTYIILIGNELNWFHIDEETGLVTTQAKLEYEVRSQFVMNISVHDGALKPLYNYTMLSVFILDENDMAPRFEKEYFIITIKEGLPSGSLVIIASAQDNDSGINGTVVYEFNSDVSQKYPSSFNIESSSGRVTTATVLDRELISEYTFRIIARDRAIVPLMSIATVHLKVLDVNDESPRFYPTQYFASVDNGQAGPVRLVQVSAVDRDAGENGQVVYSMVGMDANKFLIDSDTGWVSTISVLNRTVQSKYTLVITAQDKPGLRASNSATVEIVVTSPGDVVPRFLEELVERSITEDTDNQLPAIGSPVYQVTAATSPSNVLVSFAITDGDPNGVFSINASTGWIVRAKKIDREDTSVFKLKVIAKTSTQFNSTLVTIKINDVNDNPPVFTTSSLDADLMENWPVGHGIVRTVAVDKDEGVNARVTYTLQTNPSDVFAMESDTGLLSLKKPVKLLTSTLVQLIVTAHDSGTPQLSATHTIILHFQDVNDHTPTFAHSTFETALIESHPVNDKFYELKAYDGDVGKNAEVFYNITRGNEDRAFGIFPDSFLYIAKELDRETKDIYKLTVLATDKGVPPRSSECNVTIYIMDENDNKPIFFNAAYNMSVNENVPLKTYVGKVNASDADMGRNGEISYFLSSAQNDFSIDVETGEIFTAKQFDFELLFETTGRNYITFDVIAKDNGIRRLQAMTPVKVYIKDVNDNSPQFNRSVYDVSVSEDAAMFTSIAEIRAYDKDTGINALLTYRIVNGNIDDKFEINSFTGQLSRKQGLLDRETEDYYTLSIMATDSGIPIQNSATTIVSITVLDVNDNEPTFDQSAFEAEVPEDTEPGKSIAQFFATDIDLGLNAAITYFISGADDDGTFGIDKHTGKMFLLKKLDYEKKKEYKVNVTAIDSGIPPLSSYTKFRITIRDVNDNAPVFQKAPIFAHIQEGSSQIPDIYATAIDADSAENQVIRYSILHQEPGNFFKILPNTGLLYIDSPIDAKDFDLINITVVATDQANQTNRRLSAETVVTIFVDDINNNSPMFISFSSIIIPLNTPRNTYITAIEASDPDRGKNGTVSMTLEPGLYSDLFSLESSSGRLYLVKTLSQISTTFNISVRAQDRGPNPRETIKQFRVIISADSQNGPVFMNVSYTGNIDENSPKGREILTVKATSLGGNAVEYYLTNITLYDTGEQVDNYFEVEPASGKLYTNVVLDRETMGGKFRVEIYAMDTIVSRTTKIQAEVTVNDLNDTPPKFTSGYYKVAVREDVFVGYTILALAVDDPDMIGGLFMTITDGNDGSFKIDQNGIVVTARKLDREFVSQYTLRVQANDGSQVSYATIAVYLNDVNDNAPQFTQNMYSIDIPEDTPIGTTMEGVRATDLDEGVNKRIRYYFASEWGNDTFFLDAERGLFITLRVLDFEENQLYTLKIGAIDGGTPPLSSTVIVYMNILDVNDNTPVFDPQSYSKEVREDVKIDTSLLQVFATDVDSGSDGEVRFSIASGNDFGWFRIDPVTGKIFNTKSLDRESTPNGILLTVVATDQSLIRPLSSTVQVNITLRDVNDYAPKFVSPSTIYVNENTSLNTVVFTVSTVDLDEGDKGRVEYSLAVSSESPFSIGQTTGNLKVSMLLDRETVQNYTLLVIATDLGSPQLSSTQTLTVVIEDNNDNAPVFSQSFYQQTFREEIRIGSTLLQATATDVDAGLNGTVLYFIIGGDDNSEFSIDQSSGLLRVQKQIDFERVQQYNLTIQAEDSGPETKYATATVSITVQDVNDNAPRFINSPFIGYVRENMDNVPVQVIQVSASDDDSYPYNQVNYAIRDGDRTIFNLSSSSGEIQALKSLDREQRAEYILTVIATDSANSRGLTGSGTVRVIVEDVNDNPPVFEHSGIYTAHIRENFPPSAEVLNVRATDADESVNAQLIYYIKDGAGLPFTVFPDTGLVSTTQRLDREAQDKYILEIIAHDASLIPLSSTATVTVIVDDENDNAPQFDRPSYSKTIINSASVGSFIAGVTAVDSDAGDNGRIIYSISVESLNNFAINQQTGVITAARNLSGTGTTFSFQVTATDKGQPSKSSVVSVSVQITASSSSKTPIFNTVTPNLHVKENSGQGQVVTTVTAQSVQNGVMMYYLAGGNIAHAFSINETTGRIQVSGVVDYEMIREYRLWVEARESGNPSISGYKEVVVFIDDVNDNAPQFSQLVYDASVAEDVYLDISVIRVQAFDADDGQNKLFTFNIANETPSDVFYIDSVTGILYTGKKLDREIVDFYSVIIVAVDQGIPKQTSSTTVRINVTDLNDSEPKFTSMFSVKIPENLPVGSSILKVTTTDADIGKNAMVSYSLADDASGRFAIDSNSGSITLLKQLDAENMTINYYNLRILANDGAFIVGGNAIVFVDDVNDNTPSLLPPFEFSLLEQQPIGTFIGILSALDKDVKSPNNKTYFSLNLPSTEFSLNSENGTLTTLKEMMYFRAMDQSSQVNRYELVVITRDLGTPSRSSEQTIAINIIDRNDNPPVFEKSFYVSAVPKSIEIGRSVLFVSARDVLDYGLNAEVMYSVAGGNGSTFFQVHSVTGNVSVAAPLTNQEGNELFIFIKATDKGLPPQQSTATIKLVITGVNIYAPIFEQSITEKTVGEDISVGTTIVTFSATDKDVGLNGEVMYSIANGDPDRLFNIGRDSGILKINKSLDYEKSKEYRLNITARDKALFYREASVIFTIRLIDVNDNIPVFAKSHYDVNVEENITLGTSFFKAIAYDADTGDNAIIRYSISVSQIFDINIQTGWITTLGALDYETTQSYTVTIFSANPGSSQKNSMTLTIHVTGVNEFFPKFVQSIYDFTITENTQQNTPVGIPLRATDGDLGEDGIVYYYLVGSSNLKGFKINHTTGQISVAGSLDYESSMPKRITLEALAKNWGSIRGNDTDTCIVQISLNDTNDPPTFTQSIYQARIKENSKAGVSIITVVAVDFDDKPDDRKFSYIILAGNAGNLFQINPQSGLIQTTGQGELDREKVPIYNVTVGAVDTGQPPETGSSVVQIILEDVNDNGPQFLQFVAYVTENQLVGTTVTRLAQFTTDPDTSTPPELGFLYTELSGNIMEYSYFDIQPDGLVLTRAVIDREINPSFLVPIIVSDSGSPRMSSTLTFTVIVRDINDNTPTARHLTSFVTLLDGKLPTGAVANVKPQDQDLTGSYVCDIQTGDKSVFRITPYSCNLSIISFPTSSSYVLRIQGSDGLGSISYDTEIKFIFFNNDTLSNTIVIRIENSTGEQFMDKSYTKFINFLKGQFSPSETVILYGLMPLNFDLLLFLAVKQTNQEYYGLDSLNVKISAISSSIQLAAGIKIKVVSYSPCLTNPCYNGGVCLNEINVENDAVLADSLNQSLSNPVLSLLSLCKCLPQFTGPLCNTPSLPCGQVFCQNGAECVANSDSSKYCHCTGGWEGASCEVDIVECIWNNPCQNEATCKNRPGSYDCACKDGFWGKNCENGANYCQSNPCNNGTCKNTMGNFTCICPYNQWGDRCQYSSIGFEEGSYMEFPKLMELNNEIDVMFATIKKYSLLLYNPSSVEGSTEFLALEIVNGFVRFSFALGYEEPTRLTIPIDVTTGSWFRVRVDRNRSISKIRVSACPTSQADCDDCQVGSSCYAEGLQSSDEKLDLGNQTLTIGGIKNITMLSHLGQISTHDFVGCIRNFYINGLDKLNQEAISKSGIKNVCPRSQSTSLCDTVQCKNEGICIDEWSTVRCKCPVKYTGAQCEEKVEPFGFVPGGYILMKPKESYRRDQLLGIASRKKRSTPNDSSTFIRFRKTSGKGVLLFTATSVAYTVLTMQGETMNFTVSQYGNFKSLTLDDVADGVWHNITVIITADSIQMKLDERQPKTLTKSTFQFTSPDVVELSLGGLQQSITVDEETFKDFDGCISVFQLDGTDVPLSGIAEHYTVTVVGGVLKTCSALCTSGGSCNENAKCTPNGETVLCLPYSSGTDASLSIGVIIVIAFFGVIIIVIIVAFIICRQRRMFCLAKKRPGFENGHVKSVNNSGHNHQDSGFGEQLSEGDIIQSHIANELNTTIRFGNSGHLVRPDLIGSDTSGRLPLQMDDGTVIIDNASDLTNLRNLNDDAPEHYDLENASSIAPSDIDVFDHYRHFRDGKEPRHRHKQSHSHKHHDSSSSHKNRDSPALVTSVPYMHDIARNNSPGVRNSPLNQLSRHNPSPLSSPLTHYNVNGMPVTELKGSLANSDHSLASHNSRSSSSTVPVKPKRQMLPNGNISNTKQGNLLHNKKAHHYDNQLLKGLTMEEVDRLNSRPRESPASLQEAVSSSSENNNSKNYRKAGDRYHETNTLLDPPDTSSEDSANDSFTCSEFEYENEKGKNEFDPTSMIFSNLPEVENENDDGAHHNRVFKKSDGLDSGGNSFSSNVGSSDEGPGRTKPINGTFNWDDLLNWGPRFEKLVGVFTDIALLPDADNLDCVEGKMDSEEYV